MYITLHYITLHYITLRYVTLRYVTLRYVTLRYVTLRYIKLHYMTLHYRHFKRHLHLKWPAVHQQLHVIRNTAHRPSTQASYTASRVYGQKENQLPIGANSSNTHNIISSMAPQEFNVIPRVYFHVYAYRSCHDSPALVAVASVSCCVEFCDMCYAPPPGICFRSLIRKEQLSLNSVPCAREINLRWIYYAINAMLEYI